MENQQTWKLLMRVQAALCNKKLESLLLMPVCQLANILQALIHVDMKTNLLLHARKWLLLHTIESSP